eukprot:358009-Chlamydomonas_euryale.AAC.3
MARCPRAGRLQVPCCPGAMSAADRGKHRPQRAQRCCSPARRQHRSIPTRWRLGATFAPLYSPSCTWLRALCAMQPCMAGHHSPPDAVCLVQPSHDCSLAAARDSRSCGSARAQRMRLHRASWKTSTCPTRRVSW